MITRLFVVLAATALVAGCAHSFKHGTIAMRETDTVAHVSIHGVKTGDRVVLFHSVCQGFGVGERGAGKTCERQELAKGVVKKVFNDHYSLVEFPTGTKFAEGDFVETATK